MHIFKKLLLLCALVVATADASCPPNYTTVSGTRTDTSGRITTFNVCYPAAMLVGTTYNVYISLSRSGTAGTTGVTELCGFLSGTGFTFGAPVQNVNPAATNFNTAVHCGNRGQFLFSGGLGSADAPAGFVPVTPTVAGTYSFAASGTVDQAVGTLALPIDITVYAACPTITAEIGTGCGSGDLTPYVTGGTSPYTFFQTGTSTGGAVTVNTSGTYSFGGGGTGSFQYYATDVAGCPSNEATFNVGANPSLPNGSTIYNMMAGVPTTQSIGTTGGTPPYTYQTTGAFPTVNGSVVFNDALNQFTFTQTTPGASRITIQATDANGCVSGTRNIYFYSCPDGSAVSATLGNNNNQIALIYAICYPSYVPLNEVFNMSITMINVNPEGAVPSGPIRDFIPDSAQVTFAPGLQYVNVLSLDPEIATFLPNQPSALNQGGMGQMTYDFSIASGAVVDAVVQIQATAQGLQTYTATNIFNPGNLLTPAVSIFVGPPCDVVAGTTTEFLCLNSALTGDLGLLVSAGIPPYTFGPTGAAVGGTVNISPSGIYTFTADVGFSGAGSFGYEVTDFNTGCGPANNIVNVLVDGLSVSNTAINACTDTPIITGNLQSLASIGALPYAFSDGSFFTGGGSIVNVNGDFTFFPTPGVTGAAGFDFVVIDGFGCTAAGLVTINLSTPVVAPSGIDLCTNVSASGNLAGQVSGGALPYTFGPTGTSVGGTATIQPGGGYVFTPATGFQGQASFDYQVVDGGGCIATGSIVIDYAAPIASAGTVTTCENTPIIGGTLIATGGTPPYTFAIVTNGTLGTASITDATNGTFDYVPNPDTFGIDSFTFQVTDANGCVSNIAIFQIIINQSPITLELSLNDCVNSTLTGGLTGQLLAGIPPFVFTLTGTPFGGTASVFTDGSFTFVPAIGFSGPAGFIYEVTDANGCATTGSVDVTVASPIVGATSVSTCFNTPIAGDLAPLVTGGFPGYTFALAAQVGGTASVSLTGIYDFVPLPGFSGPANFIYQVTDSNGCFNFGSVSVGVGSLAASNANILSCEESFSSNLTNFVNGGTGALSFSGPLSPISCGDVAIAPDGSFIYTAPSGFSGPCSFEYGVTDSNGCVSTGIITVTISDPVADSLSLSGCVNSPVNGNLVGLVSGVPPFTFSLTGGVNNGSATVTPDGNFTFTPATGFSGPASFVYEVVDANACSSTGGVDITVSAPILGATAINACFQTPLVGDLSSLATSGFPPYTFGSTGVPVGGTVTVNPDGTFNFIPAVGFSGPGSFDYQVTDSNGCVSVGDVDVAIGSLVGSNANLVSCNQTFIGTLTDFVTGGTGTLIFTGPLVTTCGSVTIAPDGSFIYTAPTGFTGPCDFIFEVTDGLGCVANGVITVVANTATTVNNDAIVVCEDSSVSDTLATLVNGNPQPPLTFIIVTQPINGTLTNFNPVTGAYTYTPDADFIGVDSFQFVVVDSGVPPCTTNIGTVTITVNAAPVVVGSLLIPCANQSISDSLAGLVQGNPPQPLLFELVALPQFGTITNFNPNTGAYTYTPDAGFIGLDGFQFQVTDANGCVSNIGIITVDVIQCCPLSDDPVMQEILQIFWGMSGINGQQSITLQARTSNRK